MKGNGTRERDWTESKLMVSPFFYLHFATFISCESVYIALFLMVYTLSHHEFRTS
ncbi:hypothetical protein HanRHA438_Chr07g0320221 [Helianthus annuus]|nr:hypothetical protein HanPSC8_Chr07g0300861 [Helianthus annuus]KAJ0909309.1 hypothetical protein HanRHA438_Chr07g0320221 [Helianthus annuus]